MKKSQTILLCIIINFGSIFGLAQNKPYYWSGGIKNYLYFDEKSVIVSIKDGESIEALLDNIKIKETLNFTRKIDGGRLLMVNLKNNIQNLENFKNSYPSIEAAHFGLKYTQLEGEPPIYINGSIVLQLRKNKSIEKVLDLIENQYLIYEYTKYNTFKIIVKDWNLIFDLSNLIYESGLVDYCHPKFIFSIKNYQTITPTDPFYLQQYYLNQSNNVDINAPEAWGISRGINPIRVAVIDDGVEAHEELNNRVLLGFTPTDPLGLGAPANPGWPENIRPFIVQGHGQACAGIIGASHDNTHGIAGIFPCAEIMPINIFNDWGILTDGFGDFVHFNEDSIDLRDAIDFAWDEGDADVISNSWGAVNQHFTSDEIINAIGRARTLGRGGLGCIVVFASGNEHGTFTGVTFPANVDGVITVGAIDRNGNISSYSSRGPEMDLVAPSSGTTGDVVTTDRTGDLGYNDGVNPNYYFEFGGTSASCPQVSGVAALMLSINPNLTEAQVTEILRETATDMGSSGFDNTFGFGRLNAHAALQEVLNIDGPYYLNCPSDATTFELSFIPDNTITWTRSSNLIYVSHTDSTYTVRPNGTSGPAWVKATLTGDCGTATISKSLWLSSTFYYGEIVISGDETVVPNSYYNYSAVNNHSLPVQSWTWHVPTDWQITSQYYDNSYSSEIEVLTPYYVDYVSDIWVEVSTECGTVLSEIFFVYSGEGYLIYPNPADQYIEVRIKNKDESSLTEQEEVQNSISIKELKLYNDKNILVKSVEFKSPSTRIETDKIPPGLYIIHIVKTDGTDRKQVMIGR